ncbi:hypothetical protein [Staphylococcus sp. GDY8P193P]|uniref:hypothetical protein n=1 Tax=Staphylococcus sp. GDY8P193P TaxID=2804171 RepID=UPI001AEBFC5D|nr:hypothetical protein [Staphylococcus sp. GDY8P193P]
MKDLLFFDIEVYKHNSFVVFKNIDKETVGIFTNNEKFEGLRKFIKDKTLIGYNNHYYDNKILRAMVDGKEQAKIKQINDNIISGEYVNYASIPNTTFDCFQQIDVSNPSLKKIEGNTGRMILETDIGFDIDRELTDEELEQEMKYCAYDVENTIDVFKERKTNYFDIKENLVEMLGDKKALKWNTTTISSNILLGDMKPTTMWGNIEYYLPEGIFNNVPENVKDMWTSKKSNKKSIKIEDFDCEVEFGFGGLHGVHKHIYKAHDVKLLDVASMYPHIILNIKALPDKALKKYEEILNERIKIKHVDKKKSDALKLILNSVYGNLKNKYSALRNDNAALAVCVYGQIALYTLCKRLSETCTILNINTDGVAFTTDSEEYKKVWKDWEQEFNLTLEEDKFKTLIQKDVNNYIAVEPNGAIKVKGGDVNRYHSDAKFKNNNARILDIALVDYLVYDKSLIQTLQEYRNQPHLYQYILQAGRTYKGTYDSNEEKLQKVNRVFAAMQFGEAYRLYKVKEIDDQESWARFPDAPENMKVWNHKIYDNEGNSLIPDFEKFIDINHYYQILVKKLERWKEPV